MMKKVLFIFLCLVLSACNTMQSSADNNADDKKIATAKLNTQLGMAYLKNEDVQRAKQKLLLALDEAPTIPEPWYAMGYFLEVTGDKDEAKQDYLKAISLSPNRGDTQNNYGTFLCRSGEYQEAIQHFLLATKDQEYLDTASAYENAGLCALKIPNKQLALEYFNRAALQDPNQALSLIESAQLFYELGHPREAKQKLDEFLAISSPTTQSIMLSRKLERT